MADFGMPGAPVDPRRRVVTRKPECWIFDMDGTLADVSWRNPYDASECGKDPVNVVVAALTRILACSFAIVVTSGRKERDRRQTELWLTFNHIPFVALYMRADHDMRADAQVKAEILARDILPQFDVVAAIDDRQSVVDMWRQKGIVTFQVAERAD